MLFSIQKNATITSTTSQNTYSQDNPNNKKPYNNCSSANIVSSDTTNTSTRNLQHLAKSARSDLCKQFHTKFLVVHALFWSFLHRSVLRPRSPDTKMLPTATRLPFAAGYHMFSKYAKMTGGGTPSDINKGRNKHFGYFRGHRR